ncbi:MAG: thioredoxin fold domain-containing protein [Nitrospirae bacterium]|nr:thioredoxin fold domain-containing protein [Nitrospirota bacterium]
MKRVYVLALVAALVLMSASACDKKQGGTGKAEGGGIAWMGYTEGMAKAKETGKPVFVDFYTDWCHICKELDAGTFKDPSVIEMMNSDFVCIKVNAEGRNIVTEFGKQMTELELAQSYQVTGYPTLWFFDRGGKPVGSMPGHPPAAQLKEFLTWISGGSFAKGIEFEDYVKSRQAGAPSGAPASKEPAPAGDGHGEKK